jgi:hypothetical protein
MSLSTPVYRPNGTSDLSWERSDLILYSHPDFYPYLVTGVLENPFPYVVAQRHRDRS